MKYTEEQWQQCKEEVAKLRSELKAFNKSRVELTDSAEKEAAKQKAHELQQHYDEVLQHFNEMKRYREWSQSAQRELAAIGVDE
jgi:uncharacterized protein (DUF342 family)